MRKGGWMAGMGGGLLAVLLAGCTLSINPITGVEEKKEAAAKPAAETFAPYYCVYTSEAPKIDGLMDDPVWDKAGTITLGYVWRRPNMGARNEDPQSRTECKLLYDDQYLYVAFKAYDLDIIGEYTARDSSTCAEDVLELFFKTDPDKDAFFNFEINILGTALDAYNVKRWATGNYKRWVDWNCEGMRIAVSVKGTANDWKDRDEYWILEEAIPFAQIPTLNQAPKKGDTWLFNLCRYDYSVYLPQGQELSSYAPLSRLDFHWYEDWVKLIFR